MKFLDKIEIVAWLKSLIIALLILLLLQWTFWPMRVNGRSMEATLHHQDYMLVSKAITLVEPIQKGDLIVLDVQSEQIVKRVIGVAGDHIIIKEGQVFINGEKLEEVYSLGSTEGEVDTIVGKGYIYVLGDNRLVSRDSRSFGPVSLSHIRGKVVLKFTPTEWFR